MNFACNGNLTGAVKNVQILAKLIKIYGIVIFIIPIIYSSMKIYVKFELFCKIIYNVKTSLQSIEKQHINESNYYLHCVINKTRYKVQGSH